MFAAFLLDATVEQKVTAALLKMHQDSPAYALKLFTLYCLSQYRAKNISLKNQQDGK